jgi:hypothetical protein
LVYELPELYKALALAYERSRVDESWRIVHSRLNDLVSRAERLLAKGEILGLEFEVYMRGYGVKMLRSVEEGDITLTMDLHLELDKTLKPLEARATIAYINVILGRLITALIVMGVGVLLTVNALRLGLLIPTTISMLATGVSIGGLLLILRRSAHIVLAVASILQLPYIPIYADQNPQGLTTPLIITLISLTAVATLLILHILAKNMILRTAQGIRPP